MGRIFLIAMEMQTFSNKGKYQWMKTYFVHISREAPCIKQAKKAQRIKFIMLRENQA